MNRPAMPQLAAPADSRPPVLLVGNPNVGKSLLFKNLTGHYVTVSNYPGTTVEVVRARARFEGTEVEVVDTPGVNDLDQASAEARVTTAILDRHPGAVVVQVADAKNLRRALLLTLQLAERGRPLVLVLNMMDELERRGGVVDRERLEERLGIPVVTAAAIEQRGTREIAAAVLRARPPQIDRRLLAAVADDYERGRVHLEEVNALLADAFSLSQPRRPSLGVRLGFWAMHPVKGLFFLAAILLAMFWFVGLVGAGTLVDLLEVGLFEQRLEPLLIRAADQMLPFPHRHPPQVVSATLEIPLSPVHALALGGWQVVVPTPVYELATGAELSTAQQALRLVHDLVVGPYGLFTMALPYALAIVLPIVTTFFLLFSLLEDSGYLPRMSIMVNRVFGWMGLNGRAVLPMVLGLGCATMATVTTRILETRRERLITTMLLALAVPCSAQLGVLLAMTTRISALATLVWLVLMVAVVLLVGWLAARVFGGQRSELVLEVPPMRRPRLANLVVKTLARLRWYMLEVIPLFLLGTFVLFVLDRSGALTRIAALGRPLVEGWLGLPAEAASAFLVGFLRRDFGAVYLLDAALGREPLLDPHQVLVAMVTITLFMPCFATFLMIAKEHGRRVAVAMTAFIFPFAFAVGGLVNILGRWLGI